MSRVSLEEQVRLAYAAVQYLQHERSLIDIAEELGVSRFKAGRMVRQAKDDGLVELRVVLPDPVDADLSNQLARAYGLRFAAVVIAPTDDEAEIRGMIARAAARVVVESVTEDDIVGLVSGRTTLEMCQMIETIPQCDIVQLTGVAGDDMVQSIEIAATLRRVTGGKLFPLHAPFVATSGAAARVIADQPGVAETLTRLDNLDVALATIGGWPDSSLLAAHLERTGELDDLMRAGVIAEIGTVLLDAEGRVMPQLADRMIGITAEQLTRVPLRIAIGGGRSKENAVRATLRAGLTDVIVTDAHTARAVLREA